MAMESPPFVHVPETHEWRRLQCRGQFIEGGERQVVTAPLHVRDVAAVQPGPPGQFLLGQAEDLPLESDGLTEQG